MSDREKAVKLLDSLQENKIAYVIGYIQGLKTMEDEIEEIDPDEWDLKMIAEAEKENDGTTVSLDELLQKEGLTYADLQN